ncbi:IS1380 family transposase [Acidiphilium sp. PA]|uniref:IS1380 family transposase n=1 Tax=Acidiphilium sp. PA TaxID=2871705 RepID=UPI002244809E|nr:IS1380 family transposase [Acidiphilium sp. PA]MCW8309318.1 IS1380 family transposase [Acidiphilium sp. PA]
MAACIDDPRAPGRVVYGLDEIIRFRMLMIAAGYEDGKDADRLRRDPIFKLAMERLPEAGDLCSQATISRTENLPGPRALLRMGMAMVEQYCSSFRRVPNSIVLDIDDTFDAVHGVQQLCLFNAHHDEYGFQPIVVFDGDGRMIAAVLRPACRPKGSQIVKWLRRLIDAIRSRWPRTAIILRGDSHYCTPEVLRFCRARDLSYIFSVAPTSTLRKHVIALEASTARPGRNRHRARKFGGSRSSMMVRQAGTASSGSSRASRPDRWGRYRLYRRQPEGWIATHPISKHLLRARPG